MARFPNNPALLVMYAHLLQEARKDGQAAHTQLQLAQKAKPSMLDSYTIHVAQQSKQLKSGVLRVCRQWYACAVCICIDS